MSSGAGAAGTLYGLAIENACKARLIRDGVIEVRQGKARSLRGDHDVLAMARQAGCELTEDEQKYLGLMSYQVRVLSRYPIAKNVPGQTQFTGRAIGARAEEAAEVQGLVERILQDEDLVAIFRNGHDTGQDRAADGGPTIARS